MMKETRFGPNDALLVIDVQADFCPGGALPVDSGDEVVAPINRLLEDAVDVNVPVFISRDWHPRAHPSFLHRGGAWPAHCVQDTPGAAFHPNLRVPRSAELITKGSRFDKDQLSVFDETGLESRLNELDVRRIVVTGLAQDVCVHHTVMDALKRGFAVELIVSATRPIERAAGEGAVEEMQQAGAHLVMS